MLFYELETDETEEEKYVVSGEIWYTAAAVAAVILPIFGLAWSAFIDPCFHREDRVTLLRTALLMFILLLLSTLIYWLDSDTAGLKWKTCLCVFCYSAAPISLLFFLSIVKREKNLKKWWILVGINAVIHCSAFFSGICFRIGSDGVLQRGLLGYFGCLISGFLIFTLIRQALERYRSEKKAEILVLGFAVVLTVGGITADCFPKCQISPFLHVITAMIGSSAAFYIWLHVQAAREHELALKAEQRIQIMISQIQPHFLFNTLSTIQALCRLDPEKAFEITEKFGTYLRQNIDSLSHSELIPIAVELEHTRIYAEIEMIRFPSVQMEYQIQDDSFSVPALTVQPIVENAIRHGVRARPWGHVLVKTSCEQDGHHILIQDNGAGFDVQDLDEQEGVHIGIRNVRERVEHFCGGSMNIESTRGRGTAVTIIIPFKKEEQDESDLR